MSGPFPHSFPPPGTEGEALEQLRLGTTVLTPTVRAARRLSQAFDNFRRGEGNLAWKPANVLGWTAWTTSTWQRAVFSGYATRALLNDLQQRAVWERVLQGMPNAGMGSRSSLARGCAGALRLLGEYDLHDQFRTAYTGAREDTADFARAYRDFLAFCQRSSSLPMSHLNAELAALLNTSDLPVEPRYLLYGFGRMTPAQLAVVEALRDGGADVRTLSVKVEASAAPELYACSDPSSELRACSGWVRASLGADPAARIAIVVPDLQTRFAEIEREMRSVVAPALADVTARHAASPFAWSAGPPLANLPMIADALRLLQWCGGAVSFEDAGAVLRSRSLRLASSPERGAELDAWTLRRAKTLRENAAMRNELTISEAARTLEREDPSTAQALRHLWSSARRLLSKSYPRASFADGARRLLAQAGWPGTETPGDTEQQAMLRWESLLDNLSTLDMLGGRTDLQTFTQELASAALEASFLPVNEHASVDIMGVAEAEGCAANAVWFLHAAEGIWPPVAQPDPLLPVALQRSLRMPGSNPAEDEAHARAVLAALLHGSRSIRFSYAGSGPEGACRLSPLVEELPFAAVHSVHAGQEDPPATLPLEVVEDGDRLPIAAETSTGGISILEAQAKCGFRAFAERRLFLEPMEAVEPGLTAGDRGTQVHLVLHEFWKKVGDHEKLVSLMNQSDAGGGTGRDRVLRECIAAVVTMTPENGWDTAYLHVQRDRLMRLLSDWLDTEAKRKPFRVRDLELEVKNATIGPLSLRLRVDRVDEVDTPDGPVSVLVDYKTGARAEKSDWDGDRMDAPQLPVYAIAGRIENVRGVAFGSVRVQRDGMSFRSLLQDKDLLTPPNRTYKDKPFDEYLSQWNKDLTALAEAYARGDAAVDPKDYLNTCTHCPARLVCRVDVRELEPDDDLLEEEEVAP